MQVCCCVTVDLSELRFLTCQPISWLLFTAHQRQHFPWSLLLPEFVLTGSRNSTPKYWWVIPLLVVTHVVWNEELLRRGLGAGVQPSWEREDGGRRRRRKVKTEKWGFSSCPFIHFYNLSFLSLPFLLSCFTSFLFLISFLHCSFIILFFLLSTLYLCSL